MSHVEESAQVSPLIQSPSARPPASSLRLLLLMAGLIAGWGLLMHRFGGNIYQVMGPFALTVGLVVCALWGRALSRWLRPTTLAVTSGVAVGVGMTLLTYPVYSLIATAFPELAPNVASLYVAAHQSGRVEALIWMLLIIVAEELLWRGALLNVLSSRVPPTTGLAISVLTYAAAQFGTGSWIVALLALVCGGIWTAQRSWTDSLLSPLIAHLIWTPIVILFHPVV